MYNNIISHLKALKSNDEVLLDRIERLEHRIEMINDRLDQLKCKGDR